MRSRLVRRFLATFATRDLGLFLSRGFWAVMDQGLFAISNFVLNMLLARWLTPQEYGAFAMAYAMFWLIGVLQNALLTEPMLVFGPNKYSERLSGYLDTLVYGNLGFSALSSLLLLLGSLGVALSSASRVLALALMGLGFFAPFILFQWLMRRACYLSFRPQLAATAGILYMVLMLGGAFVLYERSWLSAPTAFALMGVSSLVAGLFLVTRLGVKPFRWAGKGLANEVFKDHWAYGRWSGATRGMSWITDSSYLLFLPIWGGLEATAAMRALMNLLMPVLHAYSALSVLLLPTLVQARGNVRFRRIALMALTLFLSGSTLYWLLLGLFNRSLVGWIYGGQYMEYAGLLWILGLLPVLAGVAEVLSTVLRSLERVDRVFWAAVASSTVALTVGLGALAAFGVVGAVVWLLVTYVTIVMAMGWFLVSIKRDSGRAD